jgi:hypothetical protein
MASVASFLLAKIVERVSTDDDVVVELDLIAKTKVIPDMKPSMRVSVLKKELKLVSKRSGSNQSVFKCFFKLAGGGIYTLINKDVLAVYKGSLVSYSKNNDKKKINQKLHLLQYSHFLI